MTSPAAPYIKVARHLFIGRSVPSSKEGKTPRSYSFTPSEAGAYKNGPIELGNRPKGRGLKFPLNEPRLKTKKHATAVLGTVTFNVINVDARRQRPRGSQCLTRWITMSAW